MKFTILSDSKASFVVHQSNSLQKMLESLGHNVINNTMGLKALGYTPTSIDAIRHQLPINQTIYKICEFLFEKHVRQSIEWCDCIIVVAPVPGIFLNNKLFIEELLREKFPVKPIVAFITEHLLALGHWYEALSTSTNMLANLGKQKHHLLERFDWYLCVSQSGLRKIPTGDIPISQIGIDMDDGSLFPEQNGDFIALVDFKRKRYINHFSVQLSALKKTNTKYHVLKGKYTINEIRSLYRKSSLYFIEHLESFGYPIAELQACGSYIVSPYDFWCCGHYLDLMYPDMPNQKHLTENFLIYNADEETLCDLIVKAKEQYDPQSIRENFLMNYNLFYYGDKNALKVFIDKIESKQITSNSHKDYRNIVPLPHHIEIHDKFTLHK